MHKKGVSIEEILDLLAIRILVKEKVECYKALGVLHLQYSPINLGLKIILPYQKITDIRQSTLHYFLMRVLLRLKLELLICIKLQNLEWQLTGVIKRG